MADIGRLTAFVASREPGGRHKGLFWAACRATESGLDPEPLIDAAENTGLPRADAERTVSSAARSVQQTRGTARR